ncbi:pyruvate kinase [Buchnera aphidicola]|uniref:pyruvate kinase n=1 Tax=Buchnera aphidicola TaxID=9 RepID=UPI000189C6AA|nr:pyruvate kinase [Buchnera aphidicola]ACL30126.1 pyruvate kinase [Buchnera aphidicola str. Tuc7 (Acyrthosiphon pisum)]ADP66139.1 pyruvate kinase [Buchnera aphidicola str. LL01 (Acyrthosiphon pisum)]ADP66711.1 pyruvate kinase [Buchnera aphidicola str. TLW03 (Acyrthosiphon pisum)]ADP67293.1 pyruvate kinase [Buchnera aphidicola str. JF99 (Acyrthosiphon pisum)]
MLNRLRRTKIVATLGPSTDINNNLEKIIRSGVNVLRFNFSHGSKDEHKSRANQAREIMTRLNFHIALLGDLQGPKIRISKFIKNNIFLNVGDFFILDANLDQNNGNQERVGIDYKQLPYDLKVGDVLLLDDGRIQLKVIKSTGHEILTKVVIGGILSNNKGINKLGGGLSADALTEKDKKDIILATEINVDYLAISFPRCSNDLKQARKLAKEFGSNAKIIAKIERAEAVLNQNTIEDIILASDAIMIARGDLGVEIGDSELAGIQKKLIRTARQLNRIVITATQMMESMITNPLPTRAEVMDVANAVLDGSDAVMLSAETASGEYPAETVIKMAKICKGAEKVPSINVSRHRIHAKFDDIEEAIAMSAMYVANHLKGITAIITMTESGKTALMTSRITSGLPIFALSKNKETLNLASLYRGVTPVYFNSKNNNFKAANEAIVLLRKRGFLCRGELVIITQGDIMGKIGKTNTSRILKVV